MDDFMVIDSTLYTEGRGGLLAFRAAMHAQGCWVANHPFGLVSSPWASTYVSDTLYVMRQDAHPLARWKRWARGEYRAYHVHIAPRTAWPPAYWVVGNTVLSDQLTGLQQWVHDQRRNGHWLSASPDGLTIPRFEPLHAHDGMTIYQAAPPAAFTLRLAERSAQLHFPQGG